MQIMRLGPVTTLPTALLLRYRQMDRAREPRHGQTWFDALVADIRRRGVLDPLVLCDDGERGFVASGNHRLAAAALLGIPVLPVRLRIDPPGTRATSPLLLPEHRAAIDAAVPVCV